MKRLIRVFGVTRMDTIKNESRGRKWIGSLFDNLMEKQLRETIYGARVSLNGKYEK